jgi:Skp family chaperone for outer membrane proteins
VKRTVAVVAGVLALGVGLDIGTRLWAQGGGAAAGGAPAAAPVTMRMRLVNLQYVLKNYKRMEALRAEHTALFKKYNDDLQKIKTESEGREKQLQETKWTPQEREAIQKEIKRLQREMADKSEEARTALGKKEGDLITLVYREVEDAVRKYAEAQGIELVLHYNDAVADSDRSSPTNIARKMSAGACMPMHVAPGLDISNEIVDHLNRKYPAAAAGGATTPGGGQ